MKLQTAIRKRIEKLDRRYVYPIMAKRRARKLKSQSFTIISNNCWGGRCYDFFGMQKKTPTVGAYFYAADYVKFCKRLRYYLSLELEIIPTKDSRYYDALLAKGQQNVLVGRLDDVEIIFLHYHDREVLLDKWKRRIDRIDWDRIIIKFSYQNQCTDELVEEFMEIEEYPKFCLVGEPVTGNKDEIVFRRNRGKETVDEIENFNWIIDPIKVLNERL